MRLTGKVDDGEFLVPACKKILTINYSGQDVDLECFMIRGHDKNHGGELRFLDGKNTWIELANFYWNDDEIVQISEARNGFAIMLGDKIPALREEAMWPCKCSHCLYGKAMPEEPMRIGSIIINLNDKCGWGRVPEENPEKNIIDWLNSLDIDFEVKE